MRLPLTGRVNVYHVAAFLTRNNINFRDVIPSDDQCDAQINIDSKYHIQVGVGYASLNESIGDGVKFGVDRFDAADIVKDIVNTTPTEIGHGNSQCQVSSHS